MSTWALHLLLSFVAPLLGSGPVQTVPGDAPPRFEVSRWTVEDGLPVQMVRDLLHGRDGYLWLVTHDGLVRFDGHRLVTFDASNTPAIPSSRLRHLVEEGDGSFWLRTNSTTSSTTATATFGTTTRPTTSGGRA